MDHARKLGELGERFLKKQQPTLEAQLADLADEIAYNNHDVDDGLRANLITINELREITLFNEEYQRVKRHYPALDERHSVHEVVRRMINRLVVDLIEASRESIQHAAPTHPDEVRRQPHALIGFSDKTRADNLELKRFLLNTMYRHYRVQRMGAKARRVVTELFEAFMNDLRLLPAEYRDAAVSKHHDRGEAGKARVIADYIAGMTDRYAISEYHRMFDPQYVT